MKSITKQAKMTTWRLDEWSEYFARRSGKSLPPMTEQEQKEAVAFLRGHHYPKPEDCPGADCPKFRPACGLGICQIASGLAGDF